MERLAAGADWQKWNQAISPTLAARRRALRLLGDKQAVRVLFDEIAPRFADRPGGYTRVLKLATPRLGDAGKPRDLGVCRAERSRRPESHPTRLRRSVDPPRRRMRRRPTANPEAEGMDAIGFNFTRRMRLLIEDIVQRLPELSHIDLSRVAISFAQARNRSHRRDPRLPYADAIHGRSTHHQTTWSIVQVQRLFDPVGQRNSLHPDLLSASLHGRRSEREAGDDPARVVAHQSPSSTAISVATRVAAMPTAHSQQQYDAGMQKLVDRWIAADPPRELYAFLELNFQATAWRIRPRLRDEDPTPQAVAVCLTGCCFTVPTRPPIPAPDRSSAASLVSHWNGRPRPAPLRRSRGNPRSATECCRRRSRRPVPPRG